MKSTKLGGADVKGSKAYGLVLVQSRAGSGNQATTGKHVGLLRVGVMIRGEE